MDDVITFGKHNGQKFTDLPADYLDWLASTTTSSYVSVAIQVARGWQPGSISKKKHKVRGDYAGATWAIVEVLGSHESGICPHCGAEGRTVWDGLTTDNKIFSAMVGCFNGAPRDEFFEESMRIASKKNDYDKKGWTLPSWDKRIKQAISDFVTGQISRVDARIEIILAQKQAEDYRNRRR